MFSVTAWACLLAWTSVSTDLHLDGQYFKDSQGRVVILRGLNVAGDAKVPPYTTMPLRSFDPLPGWGVNVVRVLFTWEAFEPHAGSYNQAYLQYYTQLVRAAAARGLEVIVDFHQDAMSRTLLGGCGDGFPLWAVPTGVPHSAPDNGAACMNWAMRMMVDKDLHRAWAAFYRGDGGARQRYIDMTRVVARHFVGEPAVLGYDMMNEPWGDEVNEINALYNDEAAAIRAVDPKAILFVSPHALVSTGMQTDLLKPTFENFVYSPHFYDNGVMGLQVWLGNSLGWSFAKMRGKAAEWNVPLFIGEFGAGAEARRVAGYMKTFHERMNEGFCSGAQWCYTPGWTDFHKDGWNEEDLSIVDNHGNWRDNFKPRPYPQKTAGVPVQLWVSDELNPRNNVLEYSWQNDPKAGATEVYVPRPVFFADEPILIQTSGSQLKCVYLQAHERVVCTSPRQGIMQVRLTTMKITAAP